MPKELKNLIAKMDALSLRERGMVFATCIVILVSLWYALLQQPLDKRAERMSDEIEDLKTRIESTNQAVELQIAQIAQTDNQIRVRLAQVERRVGELTETLEDYTAQLIEPSEMARVLEGVLERQAKLRLLRIRNLGAEPLESEEESPSQISLYKHSLEIEVEGSYLAVLDYLKELEALPWRFYWQVLELETDEYPKNHIRIQVGTLSLTEDWIGV